MKPLLVCVLLSLALPFIGQVKSPNSHLLFKPGYLIGDVILETERLEELTLLIRQEMRRKRHLELDSVQKWCDEAIMRSQAPQHKALLIDVYTQLANAHLFKSKITIARYFFQYAICLAGELGDLDKEATARMSLAYSFIYGNHYKSAEAEALHALALATITRNESLRIEIYDVLLRIEYLDRDLVKAYMYGRQMQLLAEKVGNQTILINSYASISDLFGEMNLLDKQQSLVDSCLAMVSYIKDTASLYNIYNTAYEASIMTDQHDDALCYASLLMPLGQFLNKADVVEAKMGKACLRLNRLEEAKKHYEQSLGDNLKRNLYIDTHKYLDLGLIEYGLGNKSAALKYFTAAEENIDKPLLPIQCSIYKALYEYYDDDGNEQLAFDYLKKYNHLSERKARFLDSMRYGVAILEYEGKLRENEMDRLLKDNEFNAALAYRLKQNRNLAYVGTLLILGITGIAFYRYRKYRELQHASAITSERLRISNELHDEIGSTLSGVAMYSHLAREQMKSSDIEGVTGSLVVMQSSSSEMVKKLSDIVWLMNPDRDTIADLFDRLGIYARQMGAVKKMTVKIEMSTQLAGIHIPLEARRNIYLFCKEAINNAVKYSNGSLVELKVLKVDGNFRFSVRDDGDGFDEMTVRHGNGLRNMVRRAEAIGAFCQIQSRPKEGAHIEMQYNLIH